MTASGYITQKQVHGIPKEKQSLHRFARKQWVLSGGLLSAGKSWVNFAIGTVKRLKPLGTPCDCP